MGLTVAVGCGGATPLPRGDQETQAALRESALRRSMAFFFLSSHGAGRVVVEVDRVEGVEPSESSLEELRRTIEATSGGMQVEILLDDVIPEADWKPIAALPPGRRGEMLAAWIDVGVDSTPAAAERIYLVYTPEDLSTLGWQVDLEVPRTGAPPLRLPTIFVHAGSVSRQAQLWIGERKVESFILVHEWGHVLGLVADPGHRSTETVDGSAGPGHCTSASCVMAAPDERSRIRDSAQVLVGRVPRTFCRSCLADLADARRWFDQADPGEVARRTRARSAYRAVEQR